MKGKADADDLASLRCAHFSTASIDTFFGIHQKTFTQFQSRNQTQCLHLYLLSITSRKSNEFPSLFARKHFRRRNALRHCPVCDNRELRGRSSSSEVGEVLKKCARDSNGGKRALTRIQRRLRKNRRKDCEKPVTGKE